MVEVVRRAQGGVSRQGVRTILTLSYTFFFDQFRGREGSMDEKWARGGRIR
jgi:hypothetical protein